VHNCPACGTQGHFAKHAIYQKYHFAHRIPIQRVRCRVCGVTHAMIPRFSVPGTSLGTAEAERCLVAHARGASRREASAELVQQGMEWRRGVALERKLNTSVTRAKAIWPEVASPSLHGLAWIAAVCGRCDHPIGDLNRWALTHGVNAICFCRYTILFFPACCAAKSPSHKPVSPVGFGGGITLAIAPRGQGGPP
jgi:hypothetical protein